MIFTMSDLCIESYTNLNKSKGNYIPLVDFQDRFGGVALMQPIMMNRIDLVTYLSKKHKANPDITDLDKTSPITMTSIMSDVGVIIRNAKNKSITKAIKTECSNCNSISTDTRVCSRCKITQYCNAECQKAHWKSHHKKVCNNPDNIGFYVFNEKTKLDKSAMTNAMDFKTGKKIKPWNGNPPNGFALNEYFEVKIQILNTPIGPFMIYSENRDLNTVITSTNCDGYLDLFHLVKGYEPFDGRKCFFKAKVTSPGILFIGTVQLFSRTW